MNGKEIPEAKEERYDFMRSDTGLDEGEKKYCRCLLRVEAKGNAYSPYGVCTKSVGHQVHSCSPHYDWSVMGLEYLIAYADLHKISLTSQERSSREGVLGAIARWKLNRGETF